MYACVCVCGTLISTSSRETGETAKGAVISLVATLSIDNLNAVTAVNPLNLSLKRGVAFPV